MGVFLKFLPSFAPLLNPWVLVMFLAYSIAVAGIAGVQGHKMGMAEHFRYLAAQGAETVLFITKVVKLKETIREPYVKREVVIQTVYEYIDKESANVPVRPAANITAGWMRVHDAAAEGQDRRIAGAVDDPRDTGITEAVALGQITANYRAYHQVANDLHACRAFVAGIEKLTE